MDLFSYLEINNVKTVGVIPTGADYVGHGVIPVINDACYQTHGKCITREEWQSYWSC